MITAINIILALLLSPFLMGIINRTKAKFAGRKGQPLLQAYYDLSKLLKKGSVYSTTSTMLFRLAPVFGLSAVIISIGIIPAGGAGGLFTFSCDFILMTYTLALARFLTVIAALDTGSAFEGMGASREVQFAVLSEVIMFLGLSVLAVGTGETSLSGIYYGLWSGDLSTMGPAVFLVAFAFLIILLTENSRIPVDDPNTHLELTMIHEVMVLDHCGVDLAFIQYAACLKLWLFSSLLAGMAIPAKTGMGFFGIAVNISGVFAVSVLVGIIESGMARLKLLHVPHMLLAALSVTVAAFLWVLR
ncbi:MAG: NADH-quinone oxidoreductase subunit H [Deltaproteobacteria bacterium]|nr:NADH-quinone oxidoreductase subunit H [Deltaproteobacteria bacterium]